MSIRIVCPACKTPNALADNTAGQKVRCPQCDKLLLVPAPKAAPPKRDPAAVQEDRKVAAPPKRDAAAIQEDRKVKVKSDAAPERKRPERDDADLSPRKSKKPVKKAFPVVPVALGGAGLGVCLIAALGIAIYMFRAKPAVREPQLQAKVEPAKSAPEKAPLAAAEVKKEVTPVAEAKPAVETKPAVDAKAGGALPDQMGQANVRRVKQATAYLRVTMPNGQTAEGSGFFALEPGIVVTNAHVLGMMKSGSQPPKQVDVVVNSGETTEAKLTGEVLGADRDSDLAIVRVPDNKKLPTPLAIEDDKQLFETQNVYIFGFPFGERLGKNITVSPSAISSLRKDTDGALAKIQVNGGMHPGNSGGPVVNSRGNLIGVSVAGISGTQINFAIPANQVHTMMDGRRFSDATLGEPYSKAGLAHVPVQFKCLDPLRRIREMRVEVWTGQPGAERPVSFVQPQPQPGDGTRQTHAITYQNGAGSLEVPLPALKPGEVYWLQPVIASAKGALWGPAQATTANATLIERVPANLSVNFSTQKERTVNINSLVTTSMSAGSAKFVSSAKTIVELLETVAFEPAKKLATINTLYGALDSVSTTDGKIVPIVSRQKAQEHARSVPPVFFVDNGNAVAGNVKPPASAKHPFFPEIVDKFTEEVREPYEVATINIPNRSVQPRETFPSKFTYSLRSGRDSITGDLSITCTYEGKRKRDGREEAVMTIAGQIQGRKQQKGKIEGRITGKASLDLAGGFLSLVQLKILSDCEVPLGADVSLSLHLQHDIAVARVAGNPKNLQPPATKTIPLSKGKVLLNVNATLAATDPVDPDSSGTRKVTSRMKLHRLQMNAGTTYVISLYSTAFDAYLRLLDPADKQVAEDDDCGGAQNSRIVFRAEKTGMHGIVATSFDGKTGPYRLVVHEADASGKPSTDPMNDNLAGNTYSPRNKRFTIMMPADGEVRQKTQIQRIGKLTMPVETAVCALNNGPIFTAASIGVPAAVMRQIPANKRFDNFRDSVVLQAKGRVTDEKSLTQGRLAGRDYLIEHPTGAARMQMYMDGGFVFYAIVDVKSKDELDADNVKAFFASFKMTPEAAGGNQPQQQPAQNPVAMDGATQILGGAFDPVFRDDAPAGAILIGFEIGMGKFFNNDVIRALRPIYRTPDGKEVMGKQYGSDLARVVTVKAKAGYAVGGAHVPAGLGIDAIDLIFMRVKNGKLDPSDSYKSGRNGGPGGGPTTLNGGGATVVGIVGKSKPDLCSGIGLVFKK